jgi:hypothetical protein
VASFPLSFRTKPACWRTELFAATLVRNVNSSLDGAHSGKMAACCETPIVRCSLCECQLDARIAASKRANLLQRRKVKVICGGWKTDSSVDQSDQRTEHSDFSSSTVQTCESLLLLHRGRILKSERSLMDNSLICFGSHSKNDSDLSPSSFFP